MVVWLVASCGSVATVQPGQRWPAHRRDRDARIEKLERHVKVLIEHVERAEKALATTRDELASTRQELATAREDLHAVMSVVRRGGASPGSAGPAQSSAPAPKSTSAPP